MQVALPRKETFSNDEIIKSFSQVLHYMQAKGDCEFERELKDRSIDEIKTRLNDLEDKVSQNAEELVAIKKKASKKATAILALGSSVFVTQFAVITMGTFHYLSWDIMEPVSYLMMYGNFVCGFTYYLKVKKDLTAENIHEVFTERFKRNAAKSAGIDLEKQEEMIAEIEELR